MAPPSKKNCSIVLYDCGMSNQEDGRNFVLKLFATKWLAVSKDVTKIIFTNVNCTNNVDAFKGAGKNIYVATDVTTYDPKQFELLLDKKKFEPAQADWLEALQISIKCLETDFLDIRGIVTKQLVFVTDLNTPLSDSSAHKVKTIIKDLNDCGVFLYIIGPNVKFPRCITSLEDMKRMMEVCEFVGLQCEENGKIAHEIVTQVNNATVCDLRLGLHIFMIFQNPMEGQPWQVPLTFGSQLEIPAFTLRVLNDNPQFLLVEDKSDDDSEIVWVDAEDDNVEVNFDDIVSGIIRHKKFVAMDSDVSRMLKCEGQRRFSVLGFTHKSNVPEYYLLGDGTRFVLPNPKLEEQSVALYALIDCLVKYEMYAIAVQVYMANTKPKYMALIPHINSPKCFMMVQLPFAHDVRFPYKETPPPDASRVQITTELNDFLDSLDVHGEHYTLNLPLSVNMIQNINHTKIINRTLEKYLDKHISFTGMNLDPLTISCPEECEDALKSKMPTMSVKDEIKQAHTLTYNDSNFELDDEDY